MALDVGARLQSIRKLKGLSQRELAKRAGVTNSTISMIEKNSVSPSISSLKKVLNGIPMSLVEFFTLEVESEQEAPVVYKASELLDISDGAVSMKLIGKAHPGRAIAFLDETYPPGADTGDVTPPAVFRASTIFSNARCPSGCVQTSPPMTKRICLSTALPSRASIAAGTSGASRSARSGMP